MKRTAERFQEAHYDVIVVGGGMAGVCAALASARKGVNTALINARPVLGGNASSEIRIHISGADQSLKQPDYAEGGLLYELMLENKARNDNFSYSIWDMILFEATKQQERLTLSHSAENRAIFARGAVRAAVWLIGQPPGRYTMDDVLGL